MNSLWLSLTTDTDQPAVSEATRRYLDGWLTAQQISDALTVITELVHRTATTGHGSELVLSRHDDTLLIEVIDRARQPKPAARDGRSGDNHLSPPSPAAYTWGTHPTTTGTVTWVAMPIHVPSR